MILSHSRRRRAGFSLIELLVVISMIALLAALTVGTVFKVRARQDITNSEETLRKINTLLDNRWKTVLDAAAEDSRQGRVPDAVLTFAGNDKERAKAIWTYLKLKNEFPTTFTEAKTPIFLGGVQVLNARAVYGALPNSAGGNDDKESAACLFLALSATGNRGQVSTGDGLQNQTKDVAIGSTNLKVFVDSWGTPIAFTRMAYGGELNTPRPGASSIDPCDPQGKLAGWAPASLTQLWQGVSNPPGPLTTGIRTNYSTAFGGISATYPGATSGWAPSLVSAGPDRAFSGTLGTGDDLVSYRLRKEGAKGD